MQLEYGPKCCYDGIRGYGNKDSKVVFIGSGPAYNEMREGRPFVGPNGELLNQALMATGWNRNLVYCTNVICKPDGDIDICRDRLVEELKEIQPVLFVTLGAVACEAVFGHKISKLRGFMLRNQFGTPGCFGMATWMPSAILQAEDPSDFAAEFIRDLKKIKLFYRTEPHIRLAVPPEVEKAPTIIYDAKQAQAILDNLPRDEFVTLDIETPILDKDDKLSDPFARILCVGIGLADDTQYVFPEVILDQLTFPKDVKYGGWNIYGFDAVALRARYGIEIPIANDGMLSSHVRDERPKYGTHKLKHNAREYAGAGFWEEDDTRKDFNSLAKYNGLDVAYNHRLLRYHTRSFDEDDRRLYYDLLIPAANMLSESQYYGVSVDIWKVLDLSLELGSKAVELDIQLREMAKDYGFPGDINIESSQQVSKLLFDILKIDPTVYSHRTKGGSWSVDKNVLDVIPHEWCGLLRKSRQVSDTLSRYVINANRQIKFDGKIHPKCWIPGTVTGRLSYSDPPVQQLPHARTIGDLSIVRSIFCADDDDHVLIEFDYSQIELWMMYAFSGDRNLYADLTEPWYVTGKPDYHSRTCEHGKPCLIHKEKKDNSCPVCLKWSFDRDNQKHVNFGIPYGETAHGLMRPPPIGTGLSLLENQKLINVWYARNSEFMQWIKSIEHTIKTTGVVTTPFGRKRRIPIVVNAKQLRQAVNAPIQSTASDYMLSSAVELWLILKQYDTRLLWLTHDSGLWHAPKKYLDKVIEIIKEIMEKPRIAGFPSVKTEYSYGQNLYEVSS